MYKGAKCEIGSMALRLSMHIQNVSNYAVEKMENFEELWEKKRTSTKDPNVSSSRFHASSCPCDRPCRKCNRRLSRLLAANGANNANNANSENNSAQTEGGPYTSAAAL